MGTPRKLSAVGRFLAALEKENIRFMLIGMSAAVVQGVMEATLDVDLWIDLPSRQYMRLQNIALRQGGAMGAPTVAYLADGTPLNFVFEVHGLASFGSELRRCDRLPFHGLKVPVLTLRRILKSKETIRREKDLSHIIHIKNFLRCRKSGGRAKSPTTPGAPSKAIHRTSGRRRRRH